MVALETDLWQATCEVYEISYQCIRLDATTSFGYHTITPDGLMQRGHSKVMGGAGAWQLAGDPAAQRAVAWTTSSAVIAKGTWPSFSSKIAAGESLERRTLSGERLAVADLPPVLGPTLMGGVEISRGCGLGRGFCTLAREPMEHLPEDAILADVETNLSGGVADVVLVTEDMFRYGGRGARTQPGL